MALETGTANGHIDLLDKLVEFLTSHSDLVGQGQNWELLSNSDEGFSRQYFLRAPGLTTRENIHLQIRGLEDPQNDRYNWQINSALGFSASATWQGQPNLSPDTFSYYSNKAIKYWFVGNGQRVIMVAKVSTSYVTIYLGKIHPYGTPGHFPYPVLVGGVGDKSTYRWSDATLTADVSCIANPGKGCYLYTNDGDWRQVINRAGASQNTGLIGVLPTCSGAFFSSLQWTTLDQVQANFDGSYNLIPFILGTSHQQPSVNTFGELDGMFWVTGTGNSAENIITIDDEDYLVVQNMHRSSWTEYCAVRLV